MVRNSRLEKFSNYTIVSHKKVLAAELFAAITPVNDILNTAAQCRDSSWQGTYHPPAQLAAHNFYTQSFRSSNKYLLRGGLLVSYTVSHKTLWIQLGQASVIPPDSIICIYLNKKYTIQPCHHVIMSFCQPILSSCQNVFLSTMASLIFNKLTHKQH